MTTLLDRPPIAGPPADPEVPTRHRRSPRSGAPRWALPLLGLLLVGTAALYLWNLSASGFANTFYAAAAQAGSQDWKAWFFGSLDSENFITVDKPPASLWVMGLSARIFGFSSWSILVPQALMGVGAVALLVATVRRLVSLDGRVGDDASGLAWGAGLLAGAVLALTPAAALMFRFDNPDALLVLLMTAGAYCTTRAVQAASGRWLALAGVALGFAFLTKMLQGLLVLPAFALVYLLFARTSWGRRVVHLLGAALAMIVAAGWWVAVVDLWPSDSRPYIGGSTDNSALDLALGYNGLGRILGQSGPGGGGGGGGFSGEAGWQRLLSSEMGYEISWLLPAALVALVGGVALAVAYRRRIARGPLVGLTLWGGWLLVTAAVFSVMSGTIHPYYTVALAPAIGAVIGLAGAVAWQLRDRIAGRALISAMTVAAIAWTDVLLARSGFGPGWMPWAIGIVGGLAAVAVLLPGVARSRRMLAGIVLAGALASGAGSAAFTVATAATAHTGSNPQAVASVASDQGGPGGGPGGQGGPGGGQGGPGGQMPGGDGGQGGPAPTGQASSGQTGQAPTGQNGAQGATTQGATAQAGEAGGGAGGMGGPDGQSENAELVALLQSSDARWAAAVSGSQTASGLELSSGKAVMAMGGWTNDPTPTLDEFIAHVEAGDIGYYVAGGMGGGGQGGPGGSDSSDSRSQIAAWVQEHFTATTVGGTTVYDLSAPTSEL